MKVIFAGTPEFAAEALQAIVGAGHEIVAVLTQPDRPAGRGMHLQASPVKRVAQEKNIPVLQPSSLHLSASDLEKRQEAKATLNQLEQLQFDAVIVVAYGLILPAEFLQMAQHNGRLGCLNIHASLLPRWRGAAPIQRAIEAGDQKTGIAIMKMDEGLDTGPILISEAIDIAPDETAQSLHNRLAGLGAKLIVRALETLRDGSAHGFTPQDDVGITYANKILKSEAAIDWRQAAFKIDCKVRAFNPFPGANAELEGEPIKIWKTRFALSGQTTQTIEEDLGHIVAETADGFLVRCQDQCLEVLEVQKAGGKKISARAWFLANRPVLGKRFLSAADYAEDQKTQS